MTKTRLLGQQKRGAKEAEREREKLGLQGGRKARPLTKGDNGYWGGRSAAGGESVGRVASVGTAGGLRRTVIVPAPGMARARIRKVQCFDQRTRVRVRRMVRPRLPCSAECCPVRSKAI